MLLKPKTFRKYHEADETQDASNDINSIPRCNIGLNLNVRGNGTLVVTNPEKCQLIQPPITIMGKTFVKLPKTQKIQIHKITLNPFSCQIDARRN